MAISVESAGSMVRGLRRLSGVGETELVPQARLSGPMPWVIAIMVAMTMIAAAAGLTLRNAARSATSELQGGVTVQIVEAEPGRRKAQAEAALARLRGMPGISTVRPVSQDEVDSLIEPWLGAGASQADAVPIPSLIDVHLDGGVSPDRVASLQSQLRAVAPSARVDAQSSWLGPVFDALDSLKWLAFSLVALLALALAAAVLLAARTALGTNRETIEIVHLLGGTDAQIARVFQRSIGVDAAGGGAVGTVLAAVVILFLGRRFASLDAGLVDGGALGLGEWMWLAAIPLAAIGLAMLTARFTVIHALRKML